MMTHFDYIYGSGQTGASTGKVPDSGVCLNCAGGWLDLNTISVQSVRYHAYGAAGMMHSLQHGRGVSKH